MKNIFTKQEGKLVAIPSDADRNGKKKVESSRANFWDSMKIRDNEDCAFGSLEMLLGTEKPYRIRKFFRY